MTYWQRFFIPREIFPACAAGAGCGHVLWRGADCRVAGETGRRSGSDALKVAGLVLAVVGAFICLL